MSKYPPIQIVDENDQPVRGGSMQEAHEDGLLHRIVITNIVDPAGNILLQKRSDKVATNPNRWDFASAGHVDEGEDYLTAAERELFEELGVKDVDLVEVAHYRSQMKMDWRKIDRFKKLFQGVIPADSKLTINREEVSEVRWFTPDELHTALAANPDDFTHDFAIILKRYEDHQH